MMTMSLFAWPGDAGRGRSRVNRIKDRDKMLAEDGLRGLDLVVKQRAAVGPGPGPERAQFRTERLRRCYA